MRRLFHSALLVMAAIGCSQETGTPVASAHNGSEGGPAPCRDCVQEYVLPVARTTIFEDSREPEIIAGGGVRVTLRPRDSDEGGIEVDTNVDIPGYPALSFSEEHGSSPFFEHWVGIGRLSAEDEVPAVLLGGYTGGAHCCATLQAIVPHRGRLRVLEFESIDGGPDGPFPQDVSGDGVVDFVRQDDSFRYQFVGGAASVSPPAIFNIRDGAIVDVSRDPSFRPVWEIFANETRARCADLSDDQRNGACAAYVAAAARLGRFEPAMRELERFAMDPRGCPVPQENGRCPPRREASFRSFADSLTHFLREEGYLDRPAKPARGTSS